VGIVREHIEKQNQQKASKNIHSLCGPIRDLIRRQFKKLGPKLRFFYIYAEKFGEKIGVYGSKKFDHNIGFLRKAPFFCRKSQKIVIIPSLALN
jgi:hypothetical protein